MNFPDPTFPHYTDNRIDIPVLQRPIAWPHWAATHIETYYTQRGDRELAADLTSDPRDTRIYTAKMVEKKRLGMKLKRDNIHRKAILQRNKEAGCFLRPTSYEAPHTVEEGGIRVWKEKQGNGGIRETLRIKFEGQMVSLSTHNWEQTHGPVPDGYIVAFIDGDPMNCELTNLRLLTRAENIARNRNLDKNLRQQRQALRTRAERQREEYIELNTQLEAVRKRKAAIDAGSVDERFTVDMIKQIMAELTVRENALLRDIYVLPESVKKQ